MRALTMLAANRYVTWNGTEERVTVRPEPGDVFPGVVHLMLSVTQGDATAQLKRQTTPDAEPQTSGVMGPC